MMNGPWKFVLGLLMLFFSLGSFGVAYVAKTILLQDPTLWIGIGALCFSLALTFWYVAAASRLSPASPAVSTPVKLTLPIAQNSLPNEVSFWSLLTVLFVGVVGYVVTEKQIQLLPVSFVVCIIVAFVAYLFVNHKAEIQHPMKGMDFLICIIVWVAKLYLVVLITLNYTQSLVLAVGFALVTSVFVPAMGLHVVSAAIVRFARSAFGSEIEVPSKPMVQSAPVSSKPSETNQSPRAKNEQPSYTYDDLWGDDIDDPLVQGSSGSAFEDWDFDKDKPLDADRFKYVKTEHMFDKDYNFDDEASKLDDLNISRDAIFESQQLAAQKAGLPLLLPKAVPPKVERSRQEFKPAPEPLKILIDDLTTVRGVGEVTQKTLNKAGIFTYQALVEMEPTKLLEILKRANPLMIDKKAAAIQAEAQKFVKPAPAAPPPPPAEAQEVPNDFSAIGMPAMLAMTLKKADYSIVTFADSTPDMVNNRLRARFGVTKDKEVLQKWIDAAVAYVIENG